MNILRLYATLIVAFCSLTSFGATTIEDVARQFQNKQIDIDSLFNFMETHEGETYWWALHNSEKDDPMARYILGRCYLAGIGTSQDFGKARDLLEVAKSRDIIEASVDLGRMYLNGWSVEKNVETASKLFRQASDSHSVRAIDYMGWEFMSDKKYKKALELFQQSAAAGYSGAYLDLGYMYAHGLGVEQDDKKALEYYKIAADKGNGIALCNVGLFYELGRSVDADHQTALKYYMASAAKGNPEGIYAVGHIWQWGDIPEEVSYEEAAKWYKMAVEKDHVKAKVSLAFLYFDGLGVKQDQQKAVGMLEEAGVENVNAWGACQVADYYLKNDPQSALKWAKYAYDNANEYDCASQSCLLLGKLYLKGGKDLHDYPLAVKYLKEGAEMGQPECVTIMRSLGEPFDDEDPAVSSGVK